MVPSAAKVACVVGTACTSPDEKINIFLSEPMGMTLTIGETRRGRDGLSPGAILSGHNGVLKMQAALDRGDQSFRRTSAHKPSFRLGLETCFTSTGANGWLLVGRLPPSGAASNSSSERSVGEQSRVFGG